MTKAEADKVDKVDDVDDVETDSEDELERQEREQKEQKEREYKLVAEGKMRAEVKHIDKKFSEDGKIYYTETVIEDIPEQVEWWNNYALCLVRHWDEYDKKRIDRVCLEINSTHLKDLLKGVVTSYPGVSFDTQRISLDAPYEVLFHYRKEIEAAGSKFEQGSEASAHYNVLIEWINDHFKETIAETENLLERGLVTFEHLWTIFRPGSLVYGTVFGKPRAFEVRSYASSCRPKGLYVYGDYVDFDGDDFGKRSMNRFIPAFFGSRAIQELPTFPLSWHKNQTAMEKLLIERGRQFEQQTSYKFYCYNGIALDTCFDEDDNKVVRYSVSGRIVVDTKTFHRINADHSFYVETFWDEDDDEIDPDVPFGEDDDNLIPNKKARKPLTERQCLLASSMVRGFAFQEKRWLEFFLDTLSSPNWNPNAFDQLVLPHAQKDLVRSLVATHAQHKGGFDDIIKGKGMGLIMVL